MKSVMRISIVVFICYFACSQRQASASDRVLLANDMVFEARLIPNLGHYSFLAHIDSQTQQAVPFYIQPNRNVEPLAWSPSGNQLAVARYGNDLGPLVQICILTRQAQLRVCMEEEPNNQLVFYSPDDSATYLYNVTWSADEQKLYFISETNNVFRLIESSTDTGETIRTIVSGQDTVQDFTTYSWTTQLDYLIIGAGDRARINHAGTVSLIKLLSQNSPATPMVNELVQIISPPKTSNRFSNRAGYTVPCPFSPKTNIIPVYEVSPPGISSAQFTLLDKTAKQIQGQIQLNSTTHIPQSCPSWQVDEKVLYFPYSIFDPQTGEPTSTVIEKYTPATNQVVDYYSKKDLPALASPLSVSPNGDYLAYDTYYNPGYKPTGDMFSVAPRIAVIGSNGTLFYYGPPYMSAGSPIWIPPLMQK